MKKIFLTTLAFFASFSSSSFAKTEGSYLGVNFLGARSSFYQETRAVGQADFAKVKPSNSHISYGAGLDYKYAFNFNGLFLAPGIILEQNSVGGSKNDGTYKSRLQAPSRFGAKIDLGYDITDNIAPYVTVGYAGISYKTRTTGRDSDNAVVTAVRNGTDYNAFYGAGIKIAVSQSVAVNLEYNYQSFVAKTKVPTQAADYIAKTNFVSRLDVMKIGLSYKF